MEEYSLTNREKVLAPRTGKFWCEYCDAHLVGHGEKCKNCGKRDNHKALKK